MKLRVFCLLHTQLTYHHPLSYIATAYPIFCGAAKHLSTKLDECGADEVISRGEVRIRSRTRLYFYTLSH